jgi:hypothetical protein
LAGERQGGVIMTPRRMLQSVYLGDRACKGIEVDTWNAKVRFQFDCISRIRSASGHWDYYTAEDITDGFLVFGEVTELHWANAGRLPNDLVNGVQVVQETQEGALVEISIDSVDPDATRHETKIRIACRSVYLEDPARPLQAIRE